MTGRPLDRLQVELTRRLEAEVGRDAVGAIDARIVAERRRHSKRTSRLLLAWTVLIGLVVAGVVCQHERLTHAEHRLHLVCTHAPGLCAEVLP